MTGNDLIGTSALPVGLREIRVLARKAKAYHSLRPYPWVAFQQWKEEDRGPLPLCRPFVRHIVDKGARWLFQKPVHFKVDEDQTLSALINDVWADNCMGSRSVAMAKNAALCGAVDLKWSLVDGEVTIENYDPTEHTRLYYDQSDPTKLLMARIQVPQFDYTDKTWYWYREEWTDQDWVKYERLKANNQPGESQASYNPYAFVQEADKSTFVEKSRETNPFGIVPFWRIRNCDSGDEWGMGDLWPHYALVDQVNFNYDLSHKDNQKKVDPTKVYIDLEQPSNEAAGLDDAPGSTQTLVSSGEHPGRVEVPESKSDIRDHVRQFVEDLLDDVYRSVGSVRFAAEDVTNKGNLTSAVLAQLYAPLIETTTEKRGLYGEDGFSVFFERMCSGLSKAGVKGFKADVDVQTVWPNVIEMTEDEKTVAATRQELLVSNAFTTHERATRELAVQDGVVDVDGLVKDVEAQKAENDAKAEEEANLQASIKAPVKK